MSLRLWRLIVGALIQPRSLVHMPVSVTSLLITNGVFICMVTGESISPLLIKYSYVSLNCVNIPLFFSAGYEAHCQRVIGSLSMFCVILNSFLPTRPGQSRLLCYTCARTRRAMMHDVARRCATRPVFIAMYNTIIAVFIAWIHRVCITIASPLAGTGLNCCKVMQSNRPLGWLRVLHSLFDSLRGHCVLVRLY